MSFLIIYLYGFFGLQETKKNKLNGIFISITIFWSNVEGGVLYVHSESKIYKKEMRVK